MAQHGSKDVEMGSKNTSETVPGKPAFSGDMADVKGIPPNVRRRNRCARCCAISCCLLLALVIVLVILAFTVFRVRKPQIDVRNVDLQNFNANFRLGLPPQVSINLTLGLDLFIKNPNKASFRYSNSSANLFYRGIEVGMVPIPSGSIGADGTEEILTSLTLLADRIITNSHLVPDLVSGSLPLSASTYISGRVKALGIVKRHVNVLTVCDISVSVTGSLQRSCKYDIDL